MIEPGRLMDATTDMHDLLEEGTRSMLPGQDPQDDWMEALVIDRMPAAKRTGYHLLALRIVQERAIGVAEAWLDDPATGPRPNPSNWQLPQQPPILSVAAICLSWRETTRLRVAVSGCEDQGPVLGDGGFTDRSIGHGLIRHDA
jgi:hypothetical protein